jgi:sulfate adenylyltransferase subunit 2
MNQGENFRVFPISNWTELDVWQYLAMEGIEMPSLYFSHKRRVFYRDNNWLAESPNIPMRTTEVVEEKVVRFRTIGDITSTGATLSSASTLNDIIQEVAATRVTERGGRADDKRSETSMEDRKKEGYF